MMRDTHGTVLADLGVPVHAIQARLGHTSAATTMQFYIHAGAAADRNAADAIHRALIAAGSSQVAPLDERDERDVTSRRENAKNIALRGCGARHDRGPGRDRTWSRCLRSGSLVKTQLFRTRWTNLRLFSAWLYSLRLEIRILLRNINNALAASSSVCAPKTSRRSGGLISYTV